MRCVISRASTFYNLLKKNFELSKRVGSFARIFSSVFFFSNEISVYLFKHMLLYSYVMPSSFV